MTIIFVSLEEGFEHSPDSKPNEFLLTRIGRDARVVQFVYQEVIVITSGQDHLLPGLLPASSLPASCFTSRLLLACFALFSLLLSLLCSLFYPACAFVYTLGPSANLLSLLCPFPRKEGGCSCSGKKMCKGKMMMGVTLKKALSEYWERREG